MSWRGRQALFNPMGRARSERAANEVAPELRERPTNVNWMDWIWRALRVSPPLAGPLAVQTLLTPVLRVEEDWPLQFQLENRDYTATAGTNTQAVWNPPKGEHWLLWQATVAPVLRTNETARLFYTHAGAGDTTFLRIRILSNEEEYPLVNGVFVDAGAEYYEGVRPIYIAHPNTVTLEMTLQNAGDVTEVRSLVLKKPIHQPMYGIF